MKNMKEQWVVVLLVPAVIVVGGWMCGVRADAVKECQDKYFDKVETCLGFVTGEAANPTPDCCRSVEDIKESAPKCLCYVIKMVHNGSEEAKSLGIKEPRLLQLSSACKLTNASISYCPRLLNIPATSPDYAIFTNSSAPPVATAVTGASSGAASNTSSAHKPTPVLSIASALCFCFCFCVLHQLPFFQCLIYT